ncbi:MAG: hypothetical protein H6961_00120 [Chromatiaceae bacterium]|nr:hypothetical protein [Chromatiaceae bacterium]MCP5436655.1 hypothetical protein [Chromatiaceae bacterium]HPE81656.1 hypothetical protein [Gammaproteobacteria bacterium]
MADEIKQPGNIGGILPLNRARDAGPRKRPRQPPEKTDRQKREQRPDDDQPHQVDEYV